MQAFVEVDIIVDVQAVLASAGTASQDPDEPTAVTVGLYPIAQPRFVVGGQASDGLKLKASVGNIVRWRMARLSDGTSGEPIIYGILRSEGGPVLGVVAGNIDEITVPVPVLQADGQNHDPPQASAQIQQDYFMQADVVGHGTEAYSVSFYVVDVGGPGDPIVKGYFAWMTSIEVA